MKAESISDQKRFVRGEHWLMTRGLLRARDVVHHARWRILIVAGPQPSEEVTCIRELMPKSHITAVDLDEDNILRAMAAGVDEAIIHDLADFDRTSPTSANMKGSYVASAKLGPAFDVVCLDLTGPASDDLKKMVVAYFRSLTKGGVLMVTFSYGRDVSEYFREFWRGGGNGIFVRERKIIERLEMADTVRDRVAFLVGAKISSVRSILQYRGGAMPMVSVLLHNKRTLNAPAPRFMSIQEGDFDLAVTAENLGNIYACPAERIEALRRSRIAQKAVATREARKSAKESSQAIETMLL
jgi:hypothetical protein